VDYNYPGLTVGQKIKGGNLLILGGKTANLFRVYGDHYLLQSTKDGEVIIANGEAMAMEAYNYLNDCNWPLDHITTVFEPWYAKHFLNYTEEEFPVESQSHPGEFHKVTRLKDGSLVCDSKCMGFQIRHHCYHTDFVRDFLKEQEGERK
jgi:hypothetical protein